MSNPRNQVLVALGCAVVPTLAYANAAMPLFAFIAPWTGILFVPVVALEAWVLRARLHVPRRTAILASLWTNLASSIIGAPLVWQLLAEFQIRTGGGNGLGPGSLKDRLLAVTWQAPWLYPYEGEGYWMLPAAVLYFLIPLFLASFAIEAVVLTLYLSRPRGVGHLKAIFVANLWSYLGLAGVVAVWLAIGTWSHSAGAA